jgi:hypothetical protein
MHTSQPLHHAPVPALPPIAAKAGVGGVASSYAVVVQINIWSYYRMSEPIIEFHSLVSYYLVQSLTQTSHSQPRSKYMPSPPTKRQRTEDASITRSKVWYKDGSVVLQAESTQFRVHWGVLSENSTFFRGLEDLPQPSDQPTVDGCPIVELPDAVIDVEYLLKALYDPCVHYLLVVLVHC